MKFAKAIAVLLGGPSLGIVGAFLLSALALPADPNFARNGGHGAPGDGFLIIGFILVSLLISVPLSIWLACRIAFRRALGSKPNDANPEPHRLTSAPIDLPGPAL